MAVPARPTSGVPIETAWGQVAHDTAVAQDIQVGTVTVNASASNTGSITVTFPRPFASAPIVVVSMGSHGVWYAEADSVTSVQFRALIAHRDGTAITGSGVVTWHAYGARA